MQPVIFRGPLVTRPEQQHHQQNRSSAQRYQHRNGSSTAQVLSVNGWPKGTQALAIVAEVKTWIDTMPDTLSFMIDRWHANGAPSTSAFINLKPGYSEDDMWTARRSILYELPVGHPYIIGPRKSHDARELDTDNGLCQSRCSVHEFKKLRRGH